MSEIERQAKRPAQADAGAWETIGAVLGRDMLLVGPSPRNPTGEALMLAPPCVRIQAPEGQGTVSTDGWRAALWSADAEGHRHVDVGRPSHLEPVSLAYVLGLVTRECPQHLSWVADRLERRLRNALAAQRPDMTGSVFSFTERWRRAAEAMLDELDIALTSVPGHDRPAADPGVHDPRLRPGVLRRLYEEGARKPLIRGANFCVIPARHEIRSDPDLRCPELDSN